MRGWWLDEHDIWGVLSEQTNKWNISLAETDSFLLSPPHPSLSGWTGHLEFGAWAVSQAQGTEEFFNTTLHSNDEDAIVSEHQSIHINYSSLLILIISPPVTLNARLCLKAANDQWSTECVIQEMWVTLLIRITEHSPKYSPAAVLLVTMNVAEVSGSF